MKPNQVKALLSLLECGDEDGPTDPLATSFPFTGNVIIRTVTHYYTGRVESISGGFVILNDSAWIASTGRWSNALTTGSFDEVEPYPGKVAVSLGGIIDVSPWDHDLPRKVK